MFQLDLDEEIKIDYATLQKFILSVRDGMPNNPYHNWVHIIDVTQV
jgi:hypothetical protein